MSCEFLNGNNPNNIRCNCTRGLRTLKNSSDEAGLFSLGELRQDVCQNSDSQARDQCPAFKDLKTYGHSSQYRK